MMGWICCGVMSVLWLSACALYAKERRNADEWKKACEYERADAGKWRRLTHNMMAPPYYAPEQPTRAT